MYIFASPIQFKAQNGYEIIDNTVVESNIEGFAYENKAHEIKTYFPDRLTKYFLIKKEPIYSNLSRILMSLNFLKQRKQ